MPKENKSYKTKPTVTMTSTMSSAALLSRKETTIDAVQPKVGKESSVQELKQPTSKDVLRLRYMRFKCVDMESTIDFYTTIGMNVDFKSDQELWTNPTATKRNTTNQTQGRSKVVEKDKEHIVISPLPKRAIVGLSFKVPGSTSVDSNDNIQIIFEKDDSPIVNILC